MLNLVVIKRKKKENLKNIFKDYRYIYINMANETCSPFKENWIYKILLLLVLMGILGFSLYFYYKSLNNMKHKELEGR